MTIKRETTQTPGLTIHPTCPIYFQRMIPFPPWMFLSTIIWEISVPRLCLEGIKARSAGLIPVLVRHRRYALVRLPISRSWVIRSWYRGNLFCLGMMCWRLMDKEHLALLPRLFIWKLEKLLLLKWSKISQDLKVV